MHDDADVDWTRLARYFTGECSPEEAAEVERWAAAEPGGREELAALGRWWRSAGALPSASRIDAMWQQLAREMRAEGAGPGKLGGGPGEAADPRDQREVGTRPPRETRVLSLMPAPRPRRRTWRVATAVAAAVVVAAGTALVWRTAREPTTVTVERTAPPMREYATARGQRAILQLTDGTRIDIGVESRLRVPADFALVSREVYLEGEAYFEAAHDDRKPF
ncbi:MAG: FecR domain-containing protein, partial [Gemmatimonadaceae bacterium]